MADNVTLNSGSGGATAASDDIGGVQYQRVKVTWGGDGTANDTSASNPLPVTGSQTEDTAHSAGDEGNFILGVRNDTLASLVSDDGDYAPVQVDSEGALYITGGNVVSSGNSSTSTLVADATFTGTGEDVTRFASISIAVDSDQDSATDGLSVEFSSDNTNWDHATVFTYFTANGGREIIVPVQARYFRVVYTNGGTNQSHFRLQTIYHANAVAPEVDRLQDSEPPEKDAIAVKAAILAQQSGSGDFIPIESSASGRLKVDAAIAEAIPAGSNNIGTVSLSSTDNTVLDNIDTNTSASGNHYRNIDANAEDAIKGSAGTLHWVHVMNMTASVAYLHLYDATTGNVTPGTTTPDFTFPIPTQGDTNGAGFNLPLGPNGQAFANAITLVCTTTTDGSAGDPGTNGVFVNAGYS